MNRDYFQVPNEIFEWTKTSYELLVFINILRRGNNNSDAFPSYQKIANDCHISRASVIRAIKSLDKRGLLLVVPHPYHSNTYKTIFPQTIVPETLVPESSSIVPQDTGVVPQSRGSIPQILGYSPTDPHNKNPLRRTLNKNPQEESTLEDNSSLKGINPLKNPQPLSKDVTLKIKTPEASTIFRDVQIMIAFKEKFVRLPTLPEATDLEAMVKEFGRGPVFWAMVKCNHIGEPIPCIRSVLAGGVVKQDPKYTYCDQCGREFSEDNPITFQRGGRPVCSECAGIKTITVSASKKVHKPSKHMYD